MRSVKHHNLVCPVCGSTQVFLNPETGEYVCARCGTVVDVALHDAEQANNNIVFSKTSDGIISQSAILRDNLESMLYEEAKRVLHIVSAELGYDFLSLKSVVHAISYLSKFFSMIIGDKPSNYVTKVRIAYLIGYLALTYTNAVADIVIQAIMGNPIKSAIKSLLGMNRVRRYLITNGLRPTARSLVMLIRNAANEVKKPSAIRETMKANVHTLPMLVVKKKGIEDYEAVAEFFSDEVFNAVSEFANSLIRIVGEQEIRYMTVHKLNKITFMLFKDVFARDLINYLGLNMGITELSFYYAGLLKTNKSDVRKLFIATSIDFMKRCRNWACAALSAGLISSIVKTYISMEGKKMDVALKLKRIVTKLIEMMDEGLIMEAMDRIDKHVHPSLYIVLWSMSKFKKTKDFDYVINAVAITKNINQYVHAEQKAEVGEEQ